VAQNKQPAKKKLRHLGNYFKFYFKIYIAVSALSCASTLFPNYRQHCAQRKPPVFSLLRGRFCTDGGEIWDGGGPLLRANFHPHQCNDKGVGPQKLKFLLRFDQNVDYKRPQGRIPCAIFTKFTKFCTSFHDALGFFYSAAMLALQALY